MSAAIPLIDVAPLFGAPGAARAAADRAILAAAEESGFMTIGGLPASIPIDAATRRAVLAILDVDPGVQRRLWRRKFAPENPNVYRGWFPLQSDAVTFKEGIDIGPDLVDAAAAPGGDDPLLEPTPLPREAELPGWRDAAAGYARGMTTLGATLMRAVARALGLVETTFNESFRGGISTLRIIRYPTRDAAALARVADPKLWTEHGGRRRFVSGKAHVDSGFVTLLAQDGVAGLQARARDGGWLDVPPAEGTLAVNFGKVLERWTGGRLRATEHRVLGGETTRCSIPFFYEPRVDARIAPLPGLAGPPFAPFLYGDHLWSLMTAFVEFRGLGPLRPPRDPRFRAAG
jgi:isopenicillin N synthase-like dioxygenase